MSPLPVRYLLLDRITELSPGGRALGIKACSLSGDYLADHFPGQRVMPGALIMEGLDQLGGVLVEATLRDRGRHDLHALLLSADKVRFRQSVRPGDTVALDVVGTTPPRMLEWVSHPSPAARVGARHRDRRAVITGIGVVSPFGRGLSALRAGLLDPHPATVAPHLPGFPPVFAVPPGSTAALPECWSTRGWLRDRRVPFTVTAALDAWIIAGLDVGAIGGSTRSRSTAALSLALVLEQAWLEDFLPLVTAAGLDWRRDRPGLLYRSPLDLPATAIAELLSLGRLRRIHASACAGGTLGLAQAAQWIESGEADTVPGGGGDSMLNPLGLAGLQKLGVLSPKGVCRPFDPRRDGVVVGEGAACFVVEERAAARARGARILAEVAGWGSTQDAYAPTQPRPGREPARRAMEAAIRRAGIDVDEVRVVHSHGTGTALDDEAEAAAIGAIVPHAAVTSVNGAIGHAMAAAGALEIAALLACAAEGFLPATTGSEREDPSLGLDVIRTPPARRPAFPHKAIALGARGEGITASGSVGGAAALASAIRALNAGTLDHALVVASDTLLQPEILLWGAVRGRWRAERTWPGEAAVALLLAREGEGPVVRARTALRPECGATVEPDPTGVRAAFGDRGAATALAQVVVLAERGGGTAVGDGEPGLLAVVGVEPGG